MRSFSSAQGSVTSRFLYVNSGTIAAQPHSVWTRGAKLPFATITWPLIEDALAGNTRLEARITATARDGGPACARRPAPGRRVEAGHAVDRRQ